MADLTRPIFEKKNAAEHHQDFCDYWTAVSDLSDVERWREDPYFANSLSMKVGNWIDRAKGPRQKVHKHQEFLDVWIVKAKPTNAQIEAGKRILDNSINLTDADLLIVLKRELTVDLASLVQKCRNLRIRRQKDNLSQSEGIKETSTEFQEGPTLKDLEAMKNLMPKEHFENEFGELFEKLKQDDHRQKNQNGEG